MDKEKWYMESFDGPNQKLAHKTSTQTSYPTGQNSVTWPYLTAVNAGKCVPENRI